MMPVQYAGNKQFAATSRVSCRQDASFRSVCFRKTIHSSTGEIPRALPSHTSRGATKQWRFARIESLMEVYVIAGPNGAGKTTFAREFLPNYADCKNFVNADLIAQGMAPFFPETAALRAGRTMLSEIQSFAEKNMSFAFETTLSGRGHMGLLRRLKAQGYEIHMFFLWLKSVDLALSRVSERVSRGGHDVPEDIIRRRFERSMRNFLLHYRQLALVWTLFDNSGETPRVVALGKDQKVRIINKGIFKALVNRYGQI
jgi:predicted ABC-type ATPase